MKDWKRQVKDVDRKSRKTMAMYGALHPKSDVDRLYIKRKEGCRGERGTLRQRREKQFGFLCCQF